MARASNAKVTFTRKVTVGDEQWDFVVYKDRSFTLIDPRGRHLPHDMAEWARIEPLLIEARIPFVTANSPLVVSIGQTTTKG